LNNQIVKNTNNDFWYQMRANFYEKSGNYEKAANDYKIISELLNYHSAFTFFKLGYCYKENGDYDLAIENYEKAIHIDPNDEDFYVQLGDAKRLKGDMEGAIKDYSKAIEIDPLYALAYCRRGWAKAYTQKIDNALDDYNQAIGIDPTFAYTYFCRAQSYELINDPQKAKLDYEKVVSLDSTISQQNNYKQFALFHLGKQSQATEYLNMILKQYPTKDNLYDAACLYALMNDRKTALRYLDQSFQKGYNNFTYILMNKDLDNIRELPEFGNLLKKYQSLKKPFRN
jgi:tetratricopeptide (TPR) repeat protein